MKTLVGAEVPDGPLEAIKAAQAAIDSIRGRTVHVNVSPGRWPSLERGWRTPVFIQPPPWPVADE